MNPNELLQEQMARTVTPCRDPNELNFELDQFESLNKSRQELVYSDDGANKQSKSRK